MVIAKIRYSCRCKTVEVSIKDCPDWPWVQTGDRQCTICYECIKTEFVEEGEEHGHTNTNEVKT